jgi:hypothetical protein
MSNLDILYYSKTELLKNRATYYPSHKENNDILDICYLQQVKAPLYSQEGNNVGIFQAFSIFNIDSNYGITTGTVTIQTDKGILSFIDAFDITINNEPFISNEPIITKALFIQGKYLSNGLDVYIKIIKFNDPDETRKIEVLY